MTYLIICSIAYVVIGMMWKGRQRRQMKACMCEQNLDQHHKRQHKHETCAMFHRSSMVKVKTPHGVFEVCDDCAKNCQVWGTFRELHMNNPKVKAYVKQACDAFDLEKILESLPKETTMPAPGGATTATAWARMCRVFNLVDQGDFSRAALINIIGQQKFTKTSALALCAVLNRMGDKCPEVEVVALLDKITEIASRDPIQQLVIRGAGATRENFADGTWVVIARDDPSTDPADTTQPVLGAWFLQNGVLVAFERYKNLSQALEVAALWREKGVANERGDEKQHEG